MNNIKTKASSDTKNIPAKYFEELYMSDGMRTISADMEKACIQVLEKNRAVGIIGLCDEKEYPIYCISQFALNIMGYNYEECMEACDGKYTKLVYKEDLNLLSDEFSQQKYKHYYRLYKKDGSTVLVSSCSTDVMTIDGKNIRMLSIHLEDNHPALKETFNSRTNYWKHWILESYAQSALYMYEFDLTTGLVGQDIIGEDGTNYTSVLDLTMPCDFDSLILKSLVTNLHCSYPQIEDLFSLNCKNLRKAYHAGLKRVEIEFFYIPDREYHRVEYFFSKDVESTHIMVLAVCHNVTNLKE